MFSLGSRKKLTDSLFFPNRDDYSKAYLQYQTALEKVGNKNLRLNFIDNCIKLDVIPRFLEFRVPRNCCFDDNSVHVFQKGVLRKELYSAQNDLKLARERLDTKRETIKNSKPEKTITISYLAQ